MPRRNTLLRRAFVLRADDLGRRVVRGAGFQFAGIGLRTVLTIGSTAVLARLLAPSDFGFIAMATVVTELAALFRNFGFNAVLTQRRVMTRLQVDTVFWAAAGLGLLLSVAVFILSFFVGALFADERVGELLRAMCWGFVFTSLSTVHGVVLQRLMRFRTEFGISLGIVAFRIAVATACAYSGWGVWSLVAGSLAGEIMQALLYGLAVPYRPRLRLDRAYLASTWRTNASYFGSGLLFYANMNVDLLLIGRQLGATSLGYYQTARSLTDEIRARIAMPIQQVMFPAFSALQDDPSRFQLLVIRAGRLLAAVVVPIGFGVSANAEELVLVLYGERWRPMVPVMASFGLSAALRAATAIGSPLFNACNRVGLALRYNIVGTLLTNVGVLVAMPHGIEAVAAAVALTSLYALVVFRGALRLMGLGTRQLVQILGAPLVAAAVMFLTTSALRSLSWAEVPGLLLLVHLAAGSAVYLVVLWVIAPQYAHDLRDALRMFVKRR